MAVLSIQSHVATGAAGNAAAVFPLQRLGLSVWPVHTALLSSHKGHAGWGGFVPAQSDFESLLEGIAAGGALERCEAVLVGYLARPEQAAAVAGLIGAVREANPKSLVCLDPVLGDTPGGLYVESAVAEAVASELLPLARIATPNAFELGHLCAATVDSLPAARAAAERLRARGPAVAVVTSAAVTPANLTTLVVEPAGTWRIEVPRLPRAMPGAGDAFAAILLGHCLRGLEPAPAAARAAASLHGLIAKTLARAPEASDLTLAEDQDEIVAPTIRIEPERLD